LPGHENNLCAAHTANIDGETNLKPRSAPKAIHRLATQAGDITTEAVGAVLRNLSGTVHCDQPNNIISAFAGFIELDSGEKFHYILDNVLLRGSVLARCDWCIGLVVYTGAETKVMKNNKKSPSKMSFIDRTVNLLLVIAIVIQIVMVITMTILHVTFLRDKENKFWYLPLKDKNILTQTQSYLNYPTHKYY
jgi:magnesium-transporting ATPase (P-type)